MPDEIQKSFIEELQSLDESTKRKVVIVTTVVVMLAVVYLWLGYFNGLVTGNSSAQTTQSQSQPAYESAESGGGITLPAIWDFLKNLPITVLSYLDGAVRWFANLVDGPGRYVVVPSK